MSQAVVRDDHNGYVHPFWHACQQFPSTYWDYENIEIDFNNDTHAYELIQKIGRGKYSEVFRGRNRRNGCLCVLKILKPVRSSKILREISILRNLCGGPNVVRLLDVLKDPRNQTPVLVTEYVNNPTNLRTLMTRKELSKFDLRYYIYEILRTLDFAHRRGIFHRDIKPQNVMIDHEHKILRVIDWGLAEYYIHGQALNCGVATRHYKAPELLLGYRHYDYSLDIWCTGCVLAGMLFRRDPVFVGANNDDQLLQLVRAFGTDELYAYCKKYNGVISRGVQQQLANMPAKKVAWTRKYTDWCDAEAIDLIDKMLVFDHEKRITAEAAMQHPFFAPVVEYLNRSKDEHYPLANES